MREDVLINQVYPVVARVIDQELAEYRRRLLASHQQITQLEQQVTAISEHTDRLQQMQQLLQHQLRLLTTGLPPIWTDEGEVASGEEWVPSRPTEQPPLAWPQPLHGGLHELRPYLRLLQGGGAS